MQELERVLSYWVSVSDQLTVGEVGSFGGTALIVVRMGSDEFVINRDTKRPAVRAFLAAEARAGGAGNLTWHVTVSDRGSITPGELSLG